MRYGSARTISVSSSRTDRRSGKPVAAAGESSGCNRGSDRPVYSDMESDEEIVARTLAGDRDAFRHLVARYQRLVAGVVARLIRDATDREEVCQDVFLRVYRGIGGFQFDAKLSTGIARIAYRASLNHLEKKRLPLLTTCRTRSRRASSRRAARRIRSKRWSRGRCGVSCAVRSTCAPCSTVPR
jgi:hypothetical protein